MKYGREGSSIRHQLENSRHCLVKRVPIHIMELVTWHGSLLNDVDIISGG